MPTPDPTLLLEAARCNAQCGQAVGRLLYWLYRLIYHAWGWSGVLKATGGAISVYGGTRLVWLATRPLPTFDGVIVRHGDRFEIVRPYRVNVGRRMRRGRR